MSQTRNRTIELKDAIEKLYCVEGKSLNYISNLFSLNRKEMTSVIKGELGLVQVKIRQMSPATRKRLNQHKQSLLTFFEQGEYGEYLSALAELGLTAGEARSLFAVDDDLRIAREKYFSKPPKSQTEKERKLAERISREEAAGDLEGEVWKDILGYEGLYQISNLARVKSLVNGVRILKPTLNKVHNRYYIALYREGRVKNLKVYRLVALTFLPNPENYTTVNHKDGDSTNDFLSNLEWASQGMQNEHKNEILNRPIAKAYARNGKFKQVLVDDKYRFKTLKAAASFMGVSESQIQRYVSGETKSERSVELLY